jgi:spore coat polysaccharide biosynthesis protein SpsF
MAMRAAIILQARVGSTRLPAKALAPIGETTLLERCLRRLTLADVGEVMLATTEASEDDALAEIAGRLNVRTFRGSTEDVLGRYVAAAQTLGVDVVIRATGDNPAVDIEAPARVLQILQTASADYACEDGLPIGAGVEAVRVGALLRAAAAATSIEDREHVTLYVKRRPGPFRVRREPAPAALYRPDVSLTVDTREDLDYVRRLFARTRVPDPSLTQLIAATAVCSRSDAA